jgi:hypothetical protein
MIYPPSSVRKANPMPDSRLSAVVDIELHSQATHKARQYVNDFAVTLLMQAKTLAFARRSDRVTPTHVDEAVKLLNLKRQRSWPRDIAVVFGSALFGAFVQGFASEVAAGQAYLTAAYAGLGFVGLILALWGLRR